MAPFMFGWVEAMKTGDTAAASVCIDGMAPILADTAWYTSYAGKVRYRSNCPLCQRIQKRHENIYTAWRRCKARCRPPRKSACRTSAWRCVWKVDP